MKKKVLLIEDDKIIRKTTFRILELANYRVKTAENGFLGIQLAKSFLPDILICDMSMPELDGFGVLQIVSKIPYLTRIPFVFLTEKNTTYTYLRKGMELGADDFLSKPFEESELLRVIESRLKRVAVFKKSQESSFNTNNTELHEKRVENIKNLHHFLAQKRIYNYKKEETIYCKGNLSNHVFLIKKGEVKTYKINNQGKEFITGFFTENQYFGYSSFIKGLAHFENSKAITATKLYKITKNEILEITKDNPSIVYEFIDLIASNLIDIKEQLMLLAYGSVRKKTAITLLKLATANFLNSEGKITISRSNLAKSIGIAKETLTRTLHDFKTEKLIEIYPKSIQLINKKKLLKIQ
ncbi:response regulator [Lutibacter sp.]